MKQKNVKDDSECVFVPNYIFLETHVYIYATVYLSNDTATV